MVVALENSSEIVELKDFKLENLLIRSLLKTLVSP